jgi:hypothetical protein
LRIFQNIKDRTVGITVYIFASTLVTSNNHQFKMNYEIHSINRRNKLNFSQPYSHLSNFHKGPYYMGINLYNGLPPKIKDLTNNIKQFESALLGFLHQHTFYNIDEYFNHQRM